MNNEALQFAAQKEQEGAAVALVTVISTEGSSPASPGQMMAVLADGTTAGTVGGGASEHHLAQQAAGAIQKGQATITFAFDHSAEGMVCGGSMSGVITLVNAGPRLLLFGGGHVAQKVAPLAQSCGFHVTVIEDRPEFAQDFPGTQYKTLTPEEYEQLLPISGNTYAVIATRGHRFDGYALRFLLGKPLRYIGVIGSENKVKTLFGELARDGFAKEQLDTVFAPIGLNVASGAPAEIAVSVVAEMLLLKNGGTPAHKKLQSWG